jgi:hypothetical protein
MFVHAVFNRSSWLMYGGRYMERLLATRLKTGELAGKFLAYMGRGFVQTVILLLLVYAVFRIFTPCLS